MYEPKRRKRSGLYFTVIFSLSALLGIGLGYYSNNILNPLDPRIILDPTTPPAYAEADVARVSVVTAVPVEIKDCYLVKTVDNEVCVFKLGDDGKFRFSHKLAIELSALRKSDRERFIEGFEVYSKEELAELTEDFSS